MHYVHQTEPTEPLAIAPLKAPGRESTQPEPKGSPVEVPRFEIRSAEPEVEAEASLNSVVRVRQSLVTSGDEQPISRGYVLRGYEVEPDRYVVFDRDELRNLQRRTSTNMEIVRSVRLSEIDPVFFRDLVLCRAGSWRGESLQYSV
jgi:hypothetical protein